MAGPPLSALAPGSRRPWLALHLAWARAPCRPPSSTRQRPPTVLLPGYREPPGVEPDALQKQADHCNDRRMASKRVQELSTGLFFAVLVKVRPPPTSALPCPAPPPRLLS